MAYIVIKLVLMGEEGCGKFCWRVQYLALCMKKTMRHPSKQLNYSNYIFYEVYRVSNTSSNKMIRPCQQNLCDLFKYSMWKRCLNLPYLAKKI